MAIETVRPQWYLDLLNRCDLREPGPPKPTHSSPALLPLCHNRGMHDSISSAATPPYPAPVITFKRP